MNYLGRYSSSLRPNGITGRDIEYITIGNVQIPKLRDYVVPDAPLEMHSGAPPSKSGRATKQRGKKVASKPPPLPMQMLDSHSAFLEHVSPPLREPSSQLQWPEFQAPMSALLPTQRPLSHSIFSSTKTIRLRRLGAVGINKTLCWLTYVSSTFIYLY